MQKNEQVFTNDKPLLMLHGYLSNSQSFILQKQYFSQYFRVYTPDFKGFGENKGMEKPYSLSDYCDDIKEYLKENGIERPNVIAHSFGARVAIKMTSESNDVFDKIVLTGAAGLKPRRSAKYILKRMVFKTLKPFMKKEKLLKFYSSDYLALDSVMRESFKKIVNEHLDEQVSKVQNSTLIIFGENDEETPPYMAKKLHKMIDNSKLIFIKNAGHFAFVDNPVKFNWEVKEFLLR